MPSVVVPSLVLLRSKRILYDELRDRQQTTVLDIAISCYHDPCETKDVSIDKHLVVPAQTREVVPNPTTDGGRRVGLEATK